jgi:NAD(P)-dependent dehydrogenase (short-subunit alcohol dehydrogenase family)
MKDKVVIITGASSGIGKALSFEMASRGAIVVMAARSWDKLGEIEKELMAGGYRVLAVQADVSQDGDCRRLIAETVQKFGRIDVLINNAGISMRALFEQVDLEVVRRLMDVNFWGTVCVTLSAAIKRINCRHIINRRI